jgi:hypothetical protein
VLHRGKQDGGCCTGIGQAERDIVYTIAIKVDLHDLMWEDRLNVNSEQRP